MASKKAGAHSDSRIYLSPNTLAQANDLPIAFVDHDTCTVTRTIGPVPILSLTARMGRYYVSDISR